MGSSKAVPRDFLSRCRLDDFILHPSVTYNAIVITNGATVITKDAIVITNDATVITNDATVITNDALPSSLL